MAPTMILKSRNSSQPIEVYRLLAALVTTIISQAGFPTVRYCFGTQTLCSGMNGVLLIQSSPPENVSADLGTDLNRFSKIMTSWYVFEIRHRRFVVLLATHIRVSEWTSKPRGPNGGWFSPVGLGGRRILRTVTLFFFSTAISSHP